MLRKDFADIYIYLHLLIMITFVYHNKEFLIIVLHIVLPYLSDKRLRSQMIILMLIIVYVHVHFYIIDDRFNYALQI